MAEKKFSQLTAKSATIADTDLVAISESAGGGSYVSKSVTGANIKALVTDANLTTTDITTNNVSTSKHGFVPKAPNDATQFLDGTGAYDTVKDTDLSLSDNTTNDVSTTKHGFVPKAPNDNTKFLDGTGAWSTPAGGGGGLTVGTTAVTSGTVGRIFFQGTGDVVQQDSTLFWDNTNKRLGIGATPSTSVRLDVRAQGALSTDIAFRVRNSADTANLFEIAGNGTLWARGAGNISSNITFGQEALDANTTGEQNTAIGVRALTTNTTGYYNTAIGYQALRDNTIESANTAIGAQALQNQANAYGNTAIGFQSSASNVSGVYNTSLGYQASYYQTSGNYNTTLGHKAGFFISGGSQLTSSSNSIFLGFDTRANANSETNQIVIGHEAIGLGSNTAVLGNSSIVTTQLRGNVISGNQAALATTATDGFLYIPTCAGTPTGTPTAITGKVPMVADTTNNKLYIYVGGAWTAMN